MMHEVETGKMVSSNIVKKWTQWPCYKFDREERYCTVTGSSKRNPHAPMDEIHVFELPDLPPPITNPELLRSRTFDPAKGMEAQGAMDLGDPGPAGAAFRKAGDDDTVERAIGDDGDEGPAVGDPMEDIKRQTVVAPPITKKLYQINIRRDPSQKITTWS